MKIDYVGKCALLENEGKGALVIGDLHFGYEARFEMWGVDLGGKRLKESILELEKIFEKCKEKKTDKIILLGDLKDDFSELSTDEKEKIEKFLDYLEGKGKEIIIIKGNHDNYLLNLTVKRKIEVREKYLWGENLFAHGDREVEGMWDKKIKNIFMGHLHPAVQLEEGAKSERYKCFLEGKFKKKKIIIVPSFAELGGGLDVREIEENSNWKFKWDNFKIKIIGEKEEIVNFGKIKNLV